MAKPTPLTHKSKHLSKSAEHLLSNKQNKGKYGDVNALSKMEWPDFADDSASDSSECDSDLSEGGEIQIVRI